MAKRQVFHSIKTKRDGWVVKSGGAVASKHDTQLDAQAEAVRLGKAAEKKGGLGQAVFHRADGEISQERTYGKDPRDRKG